MAATRVTVAGPVHLQAAVSPDMLRLALLGKVVSTGDDVSLLPQDVLPAASVGPLIEAARPRCATRSATPGRPRCSRSSRATRPTPGWSPWTPSSAGAVVKPPIPAQPHWGYAHPPAPTGSPSRRARGLRGRHRRRRGGSGALGRLGRRSAVCDVGGAGRPVPTPEVGRGAEPRRPARAARAGAPTHRAARPRLPPRRGAGPARHHDLARRPGHRAHPAPASRRWCARSPARSVHTITCCGRPRSPR